MKRKTTELEQKLITNGWYLTLKRYSGKRSQFTQSYEYHHDNNGLKEVIYLDKKRESIIKFGIADVKVEMLTKAELHEIHQKYLELDMWIRSLNVNVWER